MRLAVGLKVMNVTYSADELRQNRHLLYLR